MIYSNILGEDLLFVVAATLFLAVVGWAWRRAKPYELPHPLPSWFKIWFLTVQIVGGFVPLILLFWGVWQGSDRVLVVLGSYFDYAGATNPL